jgi:hypothetical protein
MSTVPKTYQTPKQVRPKPGSQLQPSQDLLEYAREYAREKPEVAALWCFGVGFILGWKLKPW